ncbi:MAG: phospholipase D-like domain-containing protein [Proteobacteria bacterium]|nr:phospholipase D-like domain-containing protein [Pseudomonadota bacterium]
MSEKTDQYKGKTDANPAESSPTITNWWFIGSPYADKYIPYGGNAIKLLNCGEEYLPELLESIKNAKNSIYIAIWGLDETLRLGLDDKDPIISTLLQDMAENHGVEVKILVWHDAAANTFGESTLKVSATYSAWWDKAVAGKFKNVEFLTRNPSNLHDSPRGNERVKSLENEKSQIYSQANYDPEVGVVLTSEEQKRVSALNNHIARLKGAGVNADDVQLERIKKGWPVADMGSFPTHHQKAILIDYSIPDKANGFVQGFNLWPNYFDYADHPWREGGAHYQDVGLHLRGPCLNDLFQNFKEGWNREVNGKAHRIDKDPLKIEPLNPKDGGLYYAQILRTWPIKEEQQIFKFIKSAIPRVNEFIYIEDQYFRMPEFAELLVQRAKTIMEKSKGQKKLYLFVVTSLNEIAKGESSVRQHMIHLLERDDVNANKETFDKTQNNQAELEKVKDKMTAQGIMVHICQLQASITGQIGSGKRLKKIVYYQNIYVHAKISFYDNAYLLLGSANWNLRSMTMDSELDIAIESHDDLAQKFREKLWGKHLKGLWKSKDKNGRTTPENWYGQWRMKLSENWGLYMLEAPLIMNLFPYFEDITNLNKKWGHPIDNKMQKSG